MKIAFIHSKCKLFRVEFLLKIQEKYDIDFFFYDKNNGNLNNFNEIKVKRIPLFSDFNYAKDLEEKLLEKDYDVYISTDLGYHITHVAYEVAKKRKKKFILWNEQWIDIKHPRRTLMKPYENKIVRESSAILAFGRKCSDFLINRGADRSNIVVVPNAVPLIDSYKVEKNKDESYPVTFNDKFNILCIARLIPVKGHKYLIKAIDIVKKKYPNIQLIIAGEGPSYNELKKLVHKLNLQAEVIIPGIAVTEEQKWTLYKKSDVVVLPSVYTRHAEAWGLVVNEAAMMAKAIITTNMTGVAGEIVRNNESGIIVNEKDIEAMADAILTLANNVDIRNYYALNSKKLVEEEYTIDNMVKGFDKVIQIVTE